jgi:hypothetical protein
MLKNKSSGKYTHHLAGVKEELLAHRVSERMKIF